MFVLLLYVQAIDGSAGSTILSEDSRLRSLSSSKAPGNSLQSTCTPATFSPETPRWVSSLFYVDSCENVVQRWFRYTQEDSRTGIRYHKVAITLATWEQEVCKLLSQKDIICPGHCSITGHAAGGAVGWGTVLQAGRSPVKFPMVSLEVFIDITLPGALWPWGWLSL